jgi:COP9 signalosome complex subunit 6
LAIIGISDHHTRISCGGSALPPSSPTIGLLFGQQSSSSSGSSISISIIDAEEVGIYQEESLMLNPTTREQMQHVQTKIELHQKVFPMHQVVGWYRVVDNNLMQNHPSSNQDEADHRMDVLPTDKDLEIHNGWMKQFHENPIFVLMDATEKNPKQGEYKVEESSNVIITDGEKARRKLDWDEQLPFTIYECIKGGSNTSNSADALQSDSVHNSAVFVNLDFELEMFEPERIAVERVLNQKSTAAMQRVPTNNNRNKDKDATDEVSEHNDLDDHDLPNPTVGHVESILTSIDAINARISILLDFLYNTRDGIIEPDYDLLRQVMSLVRQMPLVLGRHPLYQNLNSGSEVSGKIGVGGGGIQEEFNREYNDTVVMSYLATLAKLAKTIVGYSEKFHIASETQFVRTGSEASTKYQHGRR